MDSLERVNGAQPARSHSCRAEGHPLTGPLGPPSHSQTPGLSVQPRGPLGRQKATVRWQEVGGKGPKGPLGKAGAELTSNIWLESDMQAVEEFSTITVPRL